MVFLIGKSEGHLCFKWFHWWIGEELHLAPWIRENFTHTDQTVQSHTWLSRGLTLRWSMTIYWCWSSNKAAEVLIQLNLHPLFGSTPVTDLEWWSGHIAGQRKSSGLGKTPKRDYAVKICVCQSLNKEKQRALRSQTADVQKCGHVTLMAPSWFKKSTKRIHLKSVALIFRQNATL